MRIIGGLAKGRSLKTVKGYATRPTADRVKEAIFNTLAPKLVDARFLDAFAGSGALGLEALSRGAKEAVFIEKNRSAFTVLKKNLQLLNLPNTVAYCADCIKIIPILGQKKRKFDLIFLDPPYDEGFLDKALHAIMAADLLANNGIIIIETDGKEREKFSQSGLKLLKKSKYGDTSVIYYTGDSI
ncbi:MAG: 16S rRNA (guanine(966)-N(2))-methyltransferase RsmD [Bacillota bacterium]